MKTFKTLLIFSVLTTTIIASDELAWVNEQIEAIKPPRIGLKNAEIRQLKDPFIFLSKKEVEAKSVVEKPHKFVRRRHSRKRYYGLHLEAILNKSVLINGKWCKLGGKIHGYTISKINPKSVELTKHRKKKILSLKSKKTNLKLSK